MIHPYGHGRDMNIATHVSLKSCIDLDRIYGLLYTPARSHWFRLGGYAPDKTNTQLPNLNQIVPA